MKNDDILSEVFDSIKPTEVDSTVDAEATHDEVETETSEEQNELPNETVESQVQEENTEVESDDPQTETQVEPDENSVEYWKAKAEGSEKQRRDLQSYNDTRFNELTKKIEEMNKPQETKPEPVKELSKEELNDLFYEDPEKAMLYVAQKNGMTPQAQQPQVDVDFKIKEAAMRYTHTDYDDVINHFKQAIQINPQVLQEVQSQADPIKAAYDAGKKFIEAQKIQVDPVAYEAELRKKILAEQTETKTTRPSLRKVPGSPGVTSGKNKPNNSLKSVFG